VPLHRDGTPDSAAHTGAESDNVGGIIAILVIGLLAIPPVKALEIYK
jgi:hypothetical protein